MTDEEIIDQISDVRANNNINWMALLRIAMKHAPLETKVVLADIHNADQEILDLLKMLSYPSSRLK